MAKNTSVEDAIKEATEAADGLSQPVTDEQGQRAIAAFLRLVPVINRWQGETYTHYFTKPFANKGNDYASLTFNWNLLTGKDHLAMSSELRVRGIRFQPENHIWPQEYLMGMAIRACRDENGKQILDNAAFDDMPLIDCSRILSMARNFLTAAGL